MKTYKGLLLILMLGCFNPVNAQFLKKLGEKAEKAAERTIERRVERKASEKTDQAMDSVFENKKEKKSKKVKTRKTTALPLAILQKKLFLQKITK